MEYKLENEDLFDAVSNKLKFWFVPIKENNYSPRFLASRGLFYVVILLLVVKILLVSVSFNFPKYIFFADVSKVDLVRLINQERSMVGLKALGQNLKLDQAALLKAKDMAQNQYFAHTSPTGINPWFWFKKMGYNYKYAGENLAIGFTESVDVYNAWFESESHRENFLNKNYTEVGTAVLNSNFGGSNTIIVVQLFGKQKTTSITPVQTKPIVISNKTANMAVDAENGKILEIGKQAVLSETTQNPDNLLIKENDENSEKILYKQIMNMVLYRFDELLQKGIMGMFIFVSIMAVINIVVNYNFQNRKLVVKSFIMVLLLCVGTFIQKELLIELIQNKIF